MHSLYLFVYGSLLSGFKSPAYEYLSKYFKLVDEARVKGTIYDMGSYPVANATDTGRTIKGELYEIRNSNELSFVLAQLDDYEGLFPDESEEIYYKRELAETETTSGGKTIAWVYWYNSDVSDKPIIESDSMLKYFSGNDTI